MTKTSLSKEKLSNVLIENHYASTKKDCSSVPLSIRTEMLSKSLKRAQKKSTNDARSLSLRGSDGKRLRMSDIRRVAVKKMR